MALWFVLLSLIFQGMPLNSNGMVHAQGGGTPTLDQKGFNLCGSECIGAPPTQTVSVNATAGTVIVIYISWCADVSCIIAPLTTDIATVSDTVDTIVASQFCNGGAQNLGHKLFYVQSANGGSQTLTVTHAVGKGWYSSIKWSSYTGLATSSVLDQTGCASGNSTTPSATTSGNLSQSNELLTGANMNSSCTISAGSGFTILNSTGGAGNEADEYGVGGTSGATASATFTQCSAGWSSIVGTFKHS